AFGAGNLDNPNPYGLTDSEKVLLENKNNLIQNKNQLRKVEVNSNKQANKVDLLRERVDGLQSIVESINKKSHQNKTNLQKLNTQNLKELESSNEYELRLGTATQTNAETIQVNVANIEKLKLVITELSVLIDSINSQYITRDEHNLLVTDVNNFKALILKELKKKKVQKAVIKSPFLNMSNGDVATKAKYYFDKEYYTDSIKHYEYLIEKNYRPAKAHYMIGEMYYIRKNYANAISYFKKSASLYSKASYMPKLMLHTAISMDRTGDKRNAKKFYDGVILKYPNSKEAIKAEKNRE
ncbi:MAG: tetratricopeptide repeat protein, partial [Campylobacterota bacterium]|nr:tetratricopeptide repeat protein [Campylobacterota bacterium]